ncbi:uncharacterized protein LOC127858875 isoform X3 [Dreissena polymorpha]|uniref:uncharacterized protein LOC127858875 isoform X3 n=1 Tax=Dreissena polymorpha TaxID=45954 RepID=UPI0022644C83|nr:uncharacterized protein LOC127858875 isoform X3 [Dreissena polymorpha]
MQVYISRQIHHEQEKKWQIQRCTGHNCQYEITKTDEGATLTIFNIDRYRFGIYSCSALFNSSLSDSIHIQQKPESMDFTNTCTAFRMRHALSFTEKRPDKNKY